MTPSSKTAPVRRRQTQAWLPLPAGPFDILATLSQTLGTAWTVQRQIDPEGEISILAMPAGDEDSAMPTFILFERDGLAQMATVQDDEWRTTPGFATAQAAVAAIVAEIARLSNDLPTAD